MRGGAAVRPAVRRAGLGRTAIGGADQGLCPLRRPRCDLRHPRGDAQPGRRQVVVPGPVARKGEDMAQHPTLVPDDVNVAELRAGSIPWVNSIFEQPWWLDAVAPG